MRLYFDAEFTGLRQDTTLVSLGIVTGDTEARTFYAELTDYNQSQVDDWLKENVIAKLILGGRAIPSVVTHSQGTEVLGNRHFVAGHLLYWLAGQYTRIEPYSRLTFWGDWASYDWVLFCGLLGGSMELPRWISPFVRDLGQEFERLGLDPDIDRERFVYDVPNHTMKHNALQDAFVIRACHRKLEELEAKRA